jgi:hypothetical protein
MRETTVLGKQANYTELTYAADRKRNEVRRVPLVESLFAYRPLSFFPLDVFVISVSLVEVVGASFSCNLLSLSVSHYRVCQVETPGD